MGRYYATFSENHPHSGCYYVLDCSSRKEASKEMVKLFKHQWAFIYDCSGVMSIQAHEEFGLRQLIRTPHDDHISATATWAQVYTWSHIMTLTKQLARTINTKEPKYIWGVPRGGDILAVILSHMLPELEYVQLDYRKDKRGRIIPSKFDMRSKGIKPDNLVIVDDIVDTETTVSLMCPNYHVRALFQRFPSAKFSGATTTILNHTDYIVFPWEHFV